MTLYDVVQNISSQITPMTNILYYYILRTSSDNGTFLRTSYIARNSPLPNRDLGIVKWVILALKEPFEKEEDFYIKNKIYSSKILQVYFNCHLRTLEEAIEVNKILGFPHTFTIYM